MSDQKAKRFTFDEDRTGAKIPDIQELLYAKKEKKSGTSKPDKSLEPTQNLDISKIKLADAEQEFEKARKAKKSTETIESTKTFASPVQEQQNQGPREIVADLELDGSLSIEMGTQAAQTAATVAATPPNPPKFAPPTTGEIVINSIEKGKSAKGASSQPAAPKASVRKGNPPVQTQKLEHYEANALDSNPKISFGVGIKTFFERGKTTSVVIFNRHGDGFVAEQVVGEPSRAVLWRGMEILQSELSDLWGRLNKYGYSEFSTLGVSGAGNFERNGFRTAFGADRSEYVTLVKVGAGNEMTGIVAVFSSASIQTQIPFFHSALMGAPPMKKVA